MTAAKELSGLTVLVTRPARQGRNLCRLIREQDGEAIPWPAIIIEPHSPDSRVREMMAGAGSNDLVIFVSRNAVQHGRKLLGAEQRPRIAAIGPSTYEALKRVGLAPDIEPRGFDTESLLAHPGMKEGCARNVFIVRGVGGRELLGETLGRRGASVYYAEVYRRVPRASSTEERSSLLARWNRGDVNLYTATSVQLLEALHQDLGGEFSDLLASTPLVTASDRVVQRSQELRHRAERILAPGPDDRSLVNAIALWRGRSQAHR